MAALPSTTSTRGAVPPIGPASCWRLWAGVAPRAGAARRPHVVRGNRPPEAPPHPSHHPGLIPPVRGSAGGEQRPLAHVHLPAAERGRLAVHAVGEQVVLLLGEHLRRPPRRAPLAD